MILVIADDLSGAAELAGIAASHGLVSEVQTQLDLRSHASFVAVATQSRSLNHEAAFDRVFNTIEQAKAFDPDWIFKKTDSVLRGNIIPELNALAKATSKQRIVFIPANPSKNRIIVDGEYRVDGLPIIQSLFASDPEHPIRSNQVIEIMAPHDARGIQSIRRSDKSPDQGLIIPDILTAEDIEQRTTEVDEHTLPAGAADFFTALLRRKTPSREIETRIPSASTRLFVCGSLASWQAGFGKITKTKGIPTHTIEASENSLATATKEFDQQGHAALAIGERRQSSTPSTSRSLLQRLVTVTTEFIGLRNPDKIFIEGGATASALFEHMGWHQFTALPSKLTGVGCLMPKGTTKAPTFFVKPGSYPWPEDVWNL